MTFESNWKPERYIFQRLQKNKHFNECRVTAQIIVRMDMPALNYLATNSVAWLVYG